VKGVDRGIISGITLEFQWRHCRKLLEGWSPDTDLNLGHHDIRSQRIMELFSIYTYNYAGEYEPKFNRPKL
jgi:hypothetical protein